MKSIILLLLPLAIFASDVLEFTDDNFDSRIVDHPFILVEFYAPWCGHCKALAPHYEEAATKLKSTDPPVSLAKVDCPANSKTCEKFGVSGYPTLKVFKGGAFAFDYSGPRTADGIVSYVLSKAGPSSKLLSTKDELDKFISTLNPVLVGYFEKEGSAAQKAFQAVANSMSEDFRFAHTFQTSLIPEGHGTSDIILLHRPKAMANKFEESIASYSGDKTEYALKSWIEKNVFGLCGHRTQNNDKHFHGRPLVVAYYNVDYEKNPKGTNYWRNRVMKVAQGFVGKIYFAIANSQEFSGELSNDFGVENVDDTKIYVAARNAAQKFKMQEEFTMDTFETFLKELLDNKLTPFLKSEKAPSKEEQDANDVKVVTASNFNEIVNDPTKDVLIEFYAPWCGHCKSLAPKYEELAKKLKDESDLVIAKMDATANDVPSPYDVRGFPTIYFAPKGSKSSPRSYEGGREVDEFVSYLARESTNPLRGYNRDGSVKSNKEL